MAPLPLSKRRDVQSMISGFVLALLLWIMGVRIHICVSVLFAFASFSAAFFLIPASRNLFLDADLAGKDLNKPGAKDRSATKDIPESLGLVCALVYLIVMFLYIPFQFQSYLLKTGEDFPHDQFLEFICGLLSICCMILLGFADDVLNLRWRDKVFLPTIASLPLLLVYYVSFGSTTLIIPFPLRPWLGYSLELGLLFYVYQGMLAVFCTNAINIYAGINGIEAGQSVIIALTLIIHNAIQVFMEDSAGHQLSLVMLLPFLGVSTALLFHNWFPSKVFVGDTFCYFAGMTFAVVGILGHFSKTILLLFIPQVINFIISVPQLFHLVPCPRHRMPKYNEKTDMLEPSTTFITNTELRGHVKLIVSIFRFLRLAKVEEQENGVLVSNLTIINLALYWLGPTHEQTLTMYLLILQVLCSILAMTIRYGIASYFEMLVDKE